jgi:hypothetical protein
VAAPFTTPGMVATEGTPTSDQLYASADELKSNFGVECTEAQIRVAQTLLNGFCNRRSLWPEEYEERLDIPSDRNQVILSARPVLKILEAAGRYGYGRRDRRTLNSTNLDYLAVTAVFGSPTRFISIDINQIELMGATGEAWLPTGFFLVQFSTVQLKYVSGFVDIPYRIKLALVLIINEVCAKGSADRISYSVGKVSRQFANPSFVSADVRSLLQPYVVRALM